MARDGRVHDGGGGKAPSDITNVGSGRGGGKRKSPGVLADSQMNLEKVIGNTIKGTCGVAVNPLTGDVAYPAGCVVVFYSPKRHRQTQFLSCQNNRPISCICFSPDGKYVAAGEGGRQPSILVWDVKTGILQSELKGHSFSINAVRFSGDGKLLASVGSEVDGRLNVWHCKAGTIAANARVVCDVKGMAFSEDGQCLVTAGSKGHLKHWVVEGCASVTGKTRQLKGRRAVVEGGPPMSYDFVDVCFSKMSKDSLETYALSSDGFLLFFDSTRVLEKWVNLKNKSVHSLSATDRFVACACGNGLIRMFHPVTLEYVCTLPKPPAFQGGGEAGKQQQPHGGWPDAIAVSLTADSQRAVCAFADRSIFVWDVRDPAKICRCRALHAHGGSVWDVEFASDAACAAAGVPSGSFFTCSSDSTVRVWSLPHPDDGGVGASGSMAPTRDLRTVLRVGDGEEARPEGEELTGGGVRCLRVSPDGARLACGDRAGNLRLYSLGVKGMELVSMVEAHDSEVMCVEFSGDYVATCSRDRLVHVFDSKRDFDLVRTFDEHTAAVTSIKFSPSGAPGGGTRLVSCGADKCVVFRTVQQSSAAGEGQLAVNSVQRMPVPRGGGAVYDMACRSGGKSVITVGQDTQMTEWEVESGSIRTAHPTESEATLRVRLDPTGTYALCSGSDRGVRLHNLQSPEGSKAIVNSVTVHGHSEPVTGLAFSLDCERACTASGDGTIFVWRLPREASRAMKSAAAQAESSNNEGGNNKRKVPTVSDLSNVKVDEGKGAKAAAHESQKSFLSSLLDESLKAAGIRASVPPTDGAASPAEGTATPAGGSPVLVQTDLVVEDMDDVGVAEWGQGEDTKAAKQVEEEEDFVVARSEGVLASRGVLASKGVMVEAKDEYEEEEEDGVPPPKPSDEPGLDGDKSFLVDNFSSLDERTVNVDPQSSLRLSMSVSHQLKKQIEAALGPQIPAEAAESGTTTPPCSEPSHAGGSLQATPDRSTHKALNAASAQARNKKLASEIEAMRGRLQSMGMCVDHPEGAAPTPCESAIPSVNQSPAKPMQQSRRPAGEKKGQQQKKFEASPAQTPRNVAQTPVATPRTAETPPPPTQKQQAQQQHGQKQQTPSKIPAVSRPETAGGHGKSGNDKEDKDEPSLFAKMRSAGAVKAAERAEGGMSSNAGEVYKAVDETKGERPLAEERKMLREEARRRVEEELEQRKQADDEARKEKFRGAKEEAEAIRERLKELERRKAEAAHLKAGLAEEDSRAKEVEREAARKKGEVEAARLRAEAADAALKEAEMAAKQQLQQQHPSAVASGDAQSSVKEEKAAVPSKAASSEGAEGGHVIGEAVGDVRVINGIGSTPVVTPRVTGRKLVPLPAKLEADSDADGSKGAEASKACEASSADMSLLRGDVASFVENEAAAVAADDDCASASDITMQAGGEGDVAAVQEGGAEMLSTLGKGVMEWAAELGVKVVSPVVVHDGVVGKCLEETADEGLTNGADSASMNGGNASMNGGSASMNAGSASMNGGMTEGSVGRSVLSEADAAGGPAVVAGHESNVSAPFPGGSEISQGGLYDDEVFEEDDGEGGLLEQCSVQVGVTSGAEVMETPSGAGAMLDDSMASSVTASADFGDAGDSRLVRSSLFGDSHLDAAASVRQSIVSIPEGCVLEENASAPGSPGTRKTLGDAAASLQASHQAAPADASAAPAQARSSASPPTHASPFSSPSKPPRPQASTSPSRPSLPCNAVSTCKPAVENCGAQIPVESGGAPTQDRGRTTPPPAQEIAATPPTPPHHNVDDNRSLPSRPSTSLSSLPAMRQGLVTPDMHGLRGAPSSSPRGGVGASSVLLPARIADPNHPLRPGTACALDETSSTAAGGGGGGCDESYVSKSGFEDLEPADRLVGSVKASLDALNVARASNNRFAMGQLVEALKVAQQAITDAIGEEPPLPQRTTEAAGTREQSRIGGGEYTAASSRLPSARSSVDNGQGGLRMSFALSEISGGGSVDMESVLERYSERLLEVVSRKMNESMSFEAGSRNISRVGKEETL